MLHQDKKYARPHRTTKFSKVTFVFEAFYKKDGVFNYPNRCVRTFVYISVPVKKKW